MGFGIHNANIFFNRERDFLSYAPEKFLGANQDDLFLSADVRLPLVAFEL